MFCPNCAKELPADSKFCVYCRTKISRAPACKQCGALLAEDARFCTSCGQAAEGSGAPSVRRCPSCDSPSSDYDVFCQKCGTRLRSQEADEPPSLDELVTDESLDGSIDAVVNRMERSKRKRALVVVGVALLAVALAVFCWFNSSAYPKLKLTDKAWYTASIETGEGTSYRMLRFDSDGEATEYRVVNHSTTVVNRYEWEIKSDKSIRITAEDGSKTLYYKCGDWSISGDTLTLHQTVYKNEKWKATD